jgi:hypothetical protein
MERLFQSLRPVIRWVVLHPVVVLTTAAALSVLGFYGARHLRIDTDFANLIPSDYPSVQALEKLRATVGGESEAALAIESPSFAANKAFAEAIIPQVMALKDATGKPYFTSVDYRRDVTFLEDNALYFATDEELDALTTYLQDEITQAKLDANPFFFDLDEEEEEDPDAVDADSLERIYRDIVSQEYPISEDSTTLAIRFYPSDTQTNIGFIEAVYARLDSLVAALQPATFHPQMQVTTAGRLLRQAIEFRAINRDVQGSFGSGVLAVLLVVVLYFFYKSYHARMGWRWNPRIFFSELLRLPVLALLIGLPLLMSLLWTFGLAWLVYTELNLMTSTLGLVLFGLGIDYGIHFYARYSEERALGKPVVEAAETTFTSTGQATFAGALTTSAGLYVLLLADFKGFSEFGFIAGSGILFAMIGMLVVMPAFIALAERLHLLHLETARTVARPQRDWRYPASGWIVAGSLVLVAVALVFVPRIRFEYEFGALEPRYEEYLRRLHLVRRVYDDRRSRNPAYVVVDRPEDVPPVVAAVRAWSASDTLSPTIRRVESLQDRFPMTPEGQQARLERLADLRAILADPALQANPSADLDRLRRAAQTTAPITLDQVPDFLKKHFTAKDGTIGNFIIIYPDVGLSDGRQSIAFSEDVGTITTAQGQVYHAGSTSLVAADMLRLMQREAPWMVLATLLLVVMMKWINFGSWRWMLLALIPLLVGVLWMIGLMELFGQKLNFYNMIVLPSVLGIGDDAGVHLVHRYQEEGKGTIWRVLRSTGEHITMSGLTAMMGFGGLLTSFHPGLRSIGWLAVIGIGATLLAALLFLPAMIQFLESRGKIQHTPHAGA